MTRRPLSSQGTTGSAGRHWLCTCVLAGLTAPAISWVAATMGPAPPGGPERSANISLVLAKGRHCYWLPYTAWAFQAGPYGTGGATAGGKAPWVVGPQGGQGLIAARCAVTSRCTGGSANPCRRA